MRRPFASIRPVGPVFKTDASGPGLRLTDEDKVFVLEFTLGDVSDRGRSESSQFANFVKGGMRDQDVFHQTVPYSAESYTDTTYRARGHMESKDSLDKEQLKDHINDRVGGMERPRNFRVRSIKVVPEDEFDY